MYNSSFFGEAEFHSQLIFNSTLFPIYWRVTILVSEHNDVWTVSSLSWQCWAIRASLYTIL